MCSNMGKTESSSHHLAAWRGRDEVTSSMRLSALRPSATSPRIHGHFCPRYAGARPLNMSRGATRRHPSAVLAVGVIFAQAWRGQKWRPTRASISWRSGPASPVRAGRAQADVSTPEASERAAGREIGRLQPPQWRAFHELATTAGIAFRSRRRAWCRHWLRGGPSLESPRAIARSAMQHDQGAVADPRHRFRGALPQEPASISSMRRDGRHRP